MNTGWQCPVCGRGNAPTTKTCPCKPTDLPRRHWHETAGCPQCGFVGGPHYCTGPVYHGTNTPFTNDATNRYP